MSRPIIQLKKGEDRRILLGHPWIFSNEIDTRKTPLKSFAKGEEVTVMSGKLVLLGRAYINPHSLIAARLFSRDPKAELTQDFFISRLKEALLLRHRLFDRLFYRLVYSEADYLPGLIIDRFQNDFVVQINTAGMELKINEIVNALLTLFTDTHSIFLRNDSPIREQEGLPLYTQTVYGKAPDVLTVWENGLPFLAPLQGQKTGWFYDHRLNRARLKHYVCGQRVLDVFSYLGAFGIHAANYGAKRVDCIEASAFACDFIKQNAALNHVEDKVNVIGEDAFDAMKALLTQKKYYDVIILDPPAFIKKMKDKSAGLIGYQRLNELALKLLDDNGILVSCSCSMHLSADDLRALIKRAAFNTSSAVQMIERGHQGPDHPIHIALPETDYLKALFVRKMKLV